MFSTKRKIARIAPLTVFAMLLTVGFLLLVGRVTPLMAAERAAVDLGGDMAQRLEGSPFGAFPLLIDAMEDGVVAVDLIYSDRWTDVSFFFELHSDEANREYKMIMDFDLDGFALDLELHMDRHRIAVTSSILGDEFYGLTFATFREDFGPFAQMLGLDDAIANEIADIIDFIYYTMNMPEAGLDIWEPYAALLRRFIQDGTLSSESTTLETRGQEVSVTRTTFHFTDDDMAGLLRDLLITMSEDRNMDPLGMMDQWMWDDLLRELDFILDELDAFDGGMHVVMYVGPQNRLMLLVVDVYLTGGGTYVNLGLGADFGTSVFDPWYFAFVVDSESPSWADPSINDSNYIEFLFEWTYEENAGRFVNTIEITVYSENNWWDDWHDEFVHWESQVTGRLISDWNSNTGAFVLAFEEDEWGESFEVRGTYRLDSNGGFLFRLDPIDTGRETFSIEISTRIGANIQPVQNFTNFNDIPLGTFLELLMQF